MKKKAVIYTRVSTDAQAEKGYSLRDQEDMIRRYCEHNSIQILEHFQEDHSAKDFNRPEWKLLMIYLKKNKKNIDEFIFAKWDRFSRNLMESLKVIKDIKSLGISVNCLENNIDDSVPEHKLMQIISLIIPEIENDRRSLNTIGGMRRAMKEGRWPRKAPIGYKNTRDQENKIMVEVDPEIASLIREAFMMMSRGDLTQNDVRRSLVIKGLKCGKSNFPLMLKNKFYISKIVIPKYKDEPEQIVTGLHESIVNESLFYKVQDVLSGRNKKKSTSAKKFMRPELPLRGFMTCHNCGSKMTGSASKGNGGSYWYYHCCNCNTRFPASDVNSCFEKLLSNIELKEDFKELFKLAVTNQSKILVDSERRKFKNSEVLIKKYDERLQRLENSFLDGEITGSDYSQMKHKVEDDISKLKLDHAESGSKNENFMKDLLLGIDNVSNLCNIYCNSDIEGKRRVVGSIFPRKFVFEKNKVRTNEINEVIRWMISNNRGYQRLRNEKKVKNLENSTLVAPSGIEPLSKV